MRIRSYFSIFIVLFFIAGCESQKEETATLKQDAPAQEKPTPEIKPAVLLHESINVTLVETATEALPIWRDYAPLKPALFLFSNDPFLEQIPAELEDQAIDLVRNAPSQYW